MVNYTAAITTFGGSTPYVEKMDGRESKSSSINQALKGRQDVNISGEGKDFHVRKRKEHITSTG